MKKTMLILFLVGCLVTIFSCREKAKHKMEDRKTLRETSYKRIYTSYKTTPLDSVKIQLDNFLNSYPEYSLGWSFYGWVLFKMNLPDSAIVAYQKMIALNPKSAEGYAGAGAIFNTLNQNDSAENYLLKAMELRDSSAYTRMNLSMLYMKNNEREKSFAFADSSLARVDSLPDVLSGLSFVYHQQKEEARSRELFSRAVKFGLKDTTLLKQALSGELKIDDYYRRSE